MAKFKIQLFPRLAHHHKLDSRERREIIEKGKIGETDSSKGPRAKPTTTNWTQERGENDSDSNLFYHRKIDLLVLQKNRGTIASDTDSADHPNYEKVDFTILVLILDSSFMVKSFRLGG